MEKANIDLRMLCKENNIPLWFLAEKLGMADQTLYRRWRYPLSAKEHARVVSAIEAISAAEKGEASGE